MLLNGDEQRFPAIDPPLLASGYFRTLLKFENGVCEVRHFLNFANALRLLRCAVYEICSHLIVLLRYIVFDGMVLRDISTNSTTALSVCNV